ncbi:MAG: ABC transporter permease [Blastocatellia bacterium]
MVGSLRVIWRFPLRSGLMLLSGLLGVACVISAVNYASEGRLKVLNQIRRMGTNVLIVTPQQSRSVGGRVKTGSIVTTLVPRDYSEILRDVTDIDISSATVTNAFLVKTGDLSKSNCVVVGTEPTYANIKNWPVSDGDFFGQADLRHSARVAVLGSTVRRDLFGEDSPIGERIFINRVPFEVVGVLAERGQGLDAGNEDNQVYVPLTTAMHRLMNIDYFSSLIFQITNANKMDSATAQIHEILRRRHRTVANLPEDFQIQNEKTLIDTEIASSEKLGFLVWWVGFSGLVVSGLGILAICWIAVGERVREIGTRRALGATSSDIFFQFLFEAAVLSFLGCLAGLIVGWQSTQVIAQRVNLPFSFDWASAQFVIGLAVALNLTFALLPSRRASLLDPIRALNSE